MTFDTWHDAAQEHLRTAADATEALLDVDHKRYGFRKIDDVTLKNDRVKITFTLKGVEFTFIDRHSADDIVLRLPGTYTYGSLVDIAISLHEIGLSE